MPTATGARGFLSRLPVRLDSDPRQRLSWRGLLTLSAFWFAIAYVMQPLGGNILPILVARFTHPTTVNLGLGSISLDVNTYLAVLDTVGAAFAVVWQPAIGALSDASHFSIGRRRPFIAIGVVGDIIFLTLIGLVTSYWALLVAYAFFQMASNTAQGPYQGMLPDQIKDDQRAEASGYYGMMNLVGTIFGFVVVGALLIPTHHLRIAIFTLPVVVAIAGALVFFRVPDVRTMRRQDRPLGRSIFLSFAIDAKTYRDFAWLMVSRLFFLMAPVGIGTFALNFIRYTFHYSEGKASLYSSALQAIVVVFAAVLALTAGFLAERYGKKRLVAAACVIGAVGSALLIFAPNLPLILLFGIIVGISLGIFLSVDWAFMTDLIPKVEAGRYMGVSNIATASAGLIARPILAPIIDAFNQGRTSSVGYRIMFGIVTAFYLVALATLLPVREIKVE
ncbi:MAG: SLC45 family MFS transporter [Chloroflexi bacterium]|nr:MAG: SLC45 family MFS transporter [Chloroflexota bacterium]